MGVTSIGRHLRPACNLGYCRDLFLLNHQKNVIFDLNIVCFMDFRFHRHVTSGDVITPPFPCEGSGNTLGDSRLRSRIYPTPCFFESMATHWGAVWGSRTHKLTLSPRLRRVWVHTGQSFAAFWLVEMGQVNKLMTCPMLMRYVTQKKIALLSFLRSDWSLPSLAICTTKLFKYLFLLTANGDIN